jgi:hypothetical protein
MTGYRAESAIKAYAKMGKLGVWHIVHVPNADSVGDLVTISEEGMKRQLSDRTTSANGDTAGSHDSTGVEGIG